MYCKNCGTEGNGQFCSNCGQKLDTQPFTLQRLIRTAIASITEIDKGFLYNLKHLTIDFRKTVLGYLDGKRIQVYNPISYAIIGVTLLLLFDDYFGKTLNVENLEGIVSESNSYGGGVEYGTFIAQNIKYIWLLGILSWAIPASLFYRQRKFTEHLVIQAFVMGHAAFLTLLFYPFFNLRMPFNPVLVGLTLVLCIWAYWKMDKELNSLIFGPLILLFGQILLFIFPVPFHFAWKLYTEPPLKKEILVEGLKHPWSIAFLGPSEVLISEKDGGLLRVNLETGSKIPITGLPQDLASNIRATDARDNAGLFEVLLDPEYPEANWVYLSYAAQAADGLTSTKVIRAQLLGNRLHSINTLLDVQPYRADRFHYGGGMVFGADRKLFISVGERFYNEKDQPVLPVSQNPRDARGMIYRINPDGSIPPSNPDFGPESIPGAYAIGIRATQGLTVNPENNEIWFTDHGAIRGDEINILEAGANYGWPIITSGKYRNEDYVPPVLDQQDYKDPIWRWMGTVAPTGIQFYKGKQIKRLEERILVSGLSEGSLWSVYFKKGKIFLVKNLIKKNPVRLRKVTQGPDERLYILTDELNGKLIELK